ncbi:zinc finger and BTB domain-containing protein 7A-like isoform X2 [Cydia fagiglandana]|uniref:zinc finger and BTB domain-containing protein 7A-like isoform X2 n=1 Tax=Cydia fagiglandana TaxID=1458189 RepID=UPI002FEE5A5A
MESSALQGIERVCVKAEPCGDVCTTNEPTSAVISVKVERLLYDVCVNDESRCEGVSIKAEPSCSDVCVKDESLYTDHAVKDELVLGPVLMERRVRHAPTATKAIEVKQCKIVPGRPFLRDCCVRLERLAVNTLLTGTRGTDRDSSRQFRKADVGSEHRDAAVRNLKGNYGGQTPLKKPSGRPETYQCAHCEYKIARKQCLIRHLMKHSNEKPYSCGQCSYASTRKHRLQVHVLKHTGEKPYKCAEASCLWASPSEHDHTYAWREATPAPGPSAAPPGLASGDHERSRAQSEARGLAESDTETPRTTAAPTYGQFAK